MKIYISGGITGVPDYIQRFTDAQKPIEEIYHHTVINPALDNAILSTKLTYDEIMEICFREIDLCDILVMIPGWEKSNGARKERQYAMLRSMPVYEFADFMIEQRRSL